MFEQKRVFWQFEVEGAEDATRDEKEEIDNSLAEFQESAKFTRRKISLVRNNLQSVFWHNARCY